MTASLPLIAAVLVSPHIFYLWVWTRSKDFLALSRSLFGKAANPCHSMAVIAYGFKFAQIVSVLYWYLTIDGFEWPTITAFRALVLVVGVVVGQALNIGVYKALGEDGIFYGVKFEKNIPWWTGFPYNVVSHPQYVGAMITIYSATVMVYTSAHAGQGIYPLLGAWTAGYALSAVSEQYL